MKYKHVGQGDTIKMGDVTKVCNFDLYRPVRAVHTAPSGCRYADRPLPGAFSPTRVDRTSPSARRKVEATFYIPVRTGAPRPRFFIPTCTAHIGRYISVREPPATRRYRQNRPSAIDFGRRRSIEGEKGKKKTKRKRRKKKRRRRIPRAVLARTLSPPASDFSPARGERSKR
ncbi:hypothetical protein BHE74_00048244, partial [Ensete ventricosum]